MSEYVFNSASNEYDNGGLYETINLVKTFLETLATLDSEIGGAARPLKLPNEPWGLVITSDGSGRRISLGEIISGLYEDGSTRDLAAFFDALNLYSPAVDSLEDSVIEAILRLSPIAPDRQQEDLFEAVCAAGYDAMQCVVTGGTLVSFAHPRWDFHLGSVECGTGVVSFDHASLPSHSSLIAERDLSSVRSTITRNNFSSLRQRAFPTLMWGRDVDGQIDVFPSNYIGLAFKRLASLDKMARDWRSKGGGSLDRGLLELREESRLTMDNYADARRFRSSNGEMRIFQTHVWIDRGNRIHLFIDEDSCSVEVGYIGKHLPTWTN